MADPLDAARTPNEAATSRRSILLIAAVTGTWTVSLMSYYAQSQLLGPIMEEFGRGEEAVGWLFSIENAALALTTLAAAGPLARMSRTKTALLGGAFVAIANVRANYTLGGLQADTTSHSSSPILRNR